MRRVVCHNPTVKPHSPRLSAQQLFVDLFSPLYPPDHRNTALAVPCSEPSVLARIDDVAETFRHLAPELLGLDRACLDGSDASVHKLGDALTRERRDALIPMPTPSMPGVSLLATLVIHGSMYVGRCAVRNHGGAWLTVHPLWESSVRLETKLGTCDLSVFSWWLKSLSDEEVDRKPLGPRYRQHVEVPCFDSDSLPVIPSAKPIPSIAYPTRDQLFAHLAEHAPGIRAPGDAFPTADRFAELELTSVDFEWVGGDRLLLMHGLGRRGGAHLFWMNEQGFVKSAYYPADRRPRHVVRVDGDILSVIVSIDGNARRHEMPWWGL